MILPLSQRPVGSALVAALCRRHGGRPQGRPYTFDFARTLLSAGPWQREKFDVPDIANGT